MGRHTESYDITVLKSSENDSKPDYELMGIKLDIDDYIPEEIVKEIQQHTERYEQRPTPNVEEAISVNLGTEDKSRIVKLGTQLSEDPRFGFSQPLKDYQDIFAWS